MATSGSGSNKQCSQSHLAQLELSQIIITLFKNFVVLGTMFLVLHIHGAGGMGDGLQNLINPSNLWKNGTFLIILTFMLTFLSIIDRFIYNNMMLGLGLGMGVAVIVLIYPDIIKRGNEAAMVSLDAGNVAAAAAPTAAAAVVDAAATAAATE